jgi:nicotinamide-nucleotide amidase
MTAKAATEAEARQLLDAEDRELRAVLGELVFAVDEDTMESEVLRMCEARGWTLGVAESLTGGFIGGRIANVPGASRTYRGSIASYATEVKRDLLGVTSELVISEDAAREMAEAAQRVLGAEVGVSATGVAGPDEMEGQPVGTVFYGIAIPGVPTEVVSNRLPFDRERIRQFSTISVLNLLRMRLLALP